MKNLYLILAIVGGIIPYLYFFQFIQLEGLNIPLFVTSLFVNGAAAGFSVDLLISSFVFWLFMFNESKNSSNPKPLFFIIINLTVGLSCALPAYLYVKSAMQSSRQDESHSVS
ncbi:DUF2834 domain-containing protein [Paraglaciecola sp. 2405UD69-4]|uniref:DUF2834 domain-containing protein n=1 Tax=Paraglaciecola sp. 2405UD69-4 TaxID=3391836 RepID=UPI0039C8E590